MLSAMEHLQVIDTVLSWAQLESGSGHGPEFHLILQYDATHKLTHGDVNITLVTLLYAPLEAVQTMAEVQENEKSEDDGKYSTAIDLKPNRGCTSISNSWPKKSSRSNHQKRICN